MTITRVQSTGIAVNAGTPTLNVPLTGVSAGDSLILALAWNYGTGQLPLSVTDTSGNTWRIGTAPGNNPPLVLNATGSDLALIAWALNVAAAANLTVTMTLAASDTVIGGGSLSEWSGISSETSGLAVADNSGANPAVFGTVTVPPGGLVVASAMGEFGGPLVPAAPMAVIPGDTQNLSGYAIPGGGSYQPTWTNANSRSYAGAAAIFAPASTRRSGLVPVLGSL